MTTRNYHKRHNDAAGIILPDVIAMSVIQHLEEKWPGAAWDDIIIGLKNAADWHRYRRDVDIYGEPEIQR